MISIGEKTLSEARVGSTAISQIRIGPSMLWSSASTPVYWMKYNQQATPVIDSVDYCTSAGNGYYSILGNLTTNTARVFHAMVDVVLDHQYVYMAVDEDFPYALGSADIRVSNPITSNSTYLTKKGWNNFTILSNKSGFQRMGVAKGSSFQPDYPFLVKFQIVDLTDMFGEGFEPDITTWKQIISGITGYTDYTEAEWMRAPEGIVTAYTTPE